MTIYFTSNHDMSLVTSDSEILPTDAQLSAIEDTIELDESTELDAELFGDDYANEVINSIGFFNAHYGEL